MESISTLDKKVLIILGGSSFMGLTLLEQLSNQIELYKAIYVLNRGKIYWDGRSTEIMSQHSEIIKHIKADRDK